MKLPFFFFITIILHIGIANQSFAQSEKEPPLSNKEYFRIQNKHILKFNPFSPFFGGVSLSYEQAIAPRRSLEFKFGFTVNPNKDSNFSDGFLIGIGHKFFTSPIHSKRRGWTVPIVQGFYIQPELLLGFFNENKVSTRPVFRGPPILFPREKAKRNYQVLMANFGLQTIFGKVIILDLHTGIGYGRDSINQKLGGPNTYHNLIKSEGPWSLAINLGVRLGIWF